MLPILLHMHQPDYRDPVTGDPVLPWVRKHALRGYRDVPWILKKTGARATVNLVPSLLDQLDHYAAGGSDPLLRLLESPLASLTRGDALLLAEQALLGSARRFDWFPAFAESRLRPASALSPAELLDRVVWGELSWFGFSALQDYPLLAELRRRQRDYSQRDLDAVVAIERHILTHLRDLYRDLPEVSCSPYFHPILPLLVDNAHAQRCNPGVPDPGFRFPDDAVVQLRDGRRRVEDWCGQPVRGLWPSEGSVSPEIARIVRDLGFSWMASDEEVLRRSTSAPEPGAPGDFEGMRLVFRDHGLSDRVGFAYQDVDGTRAALDLLGAVGARLAHRPHAGAVLLALDGENPWEHYPDAGEGFLTALFESGRTHTVQDFVDRVPARPLEALHTGSWINANFQIWIGHAEDRLAWELLAEARRSWERAGRPPAARRHLFAAEGSDWFWWYGDEFSTPVAHVFDGLFRAHLAAAYRQMGLAPDPRLKAPIKRSSDDGEHVVVRALGPGEGWLAWQGIVPMPVRGGAMARVGGPARLWVGLRTETELVVRASDSQGWMIEVDEKTAAFADGVAVVTLAPAWTALTLTLCAPDGALVASWTLLRR
jgi:alpha-amylase/alpha-mannosidase (GH57 family)